MHHAPFFNRTRHSQAHPYPVPASFLEHYLNSNAEQDHCLLAFWRRFRELGRDDVHLFIVPDHSLWVHGVPAYPDAGFATWLAYVPPARRASEFKPRAVASPTPSQAQLYPTILELLGAARERGALVGVGEVPLVRGRRAGGEHQNQHDCGNDPAASHNESHYRHGPRGVNRKVKVIFKKRPDACAASGSETYSNRRPAAVTISRTLAACRSEIALES